MKATHNCRNCQADLEIHKEMKGHKLAKTVLKKKNNFEVYYKALVTKDCVVMT